MNGKKLMFIANSQRLNFQAKDMDDDSIVKESVMSWLGASKDFPLTVRSTYQRFEF